MFCIDLDDAGTDYLPRIFGRHGFVRVDPVKRPPERLTMLYLRLTI